MIDQRWSPERIRNWYNSLPWLVGCNFIPSTAGNQLELWNAGHFDQETIARELDWAAGLGMNAIRVFLHDLAWNTDPERFLHRIDVLLSLAHERGIRTMPVLFDDCWYEPGSLGRSPEPRPGVHNSIWLRSPGLQAARSAAQEERLAAYVHGTVSAFARDERVLAWDVYNEVGNFFLPLLSLPGGIRQLRLLARGLAFYLAPIPTLPLLRKAFRWVREAAPVQPLTSPLWFSHVRLNRELISLSDIISFHNYKNPEELDKQVRELVGDPHCEGRPLLCTEYLARSTGSRFESCLPVFKERGIGCFNWGFVSGRTQTIYSWEDHGSSTSSTEAGMVQAGKNHEPELWYHDIVRPDGSPWDLAEIDFIRAATRKDR